MTAHTLPVLAIGPKGGKIVGYAHGDLKKPIYLGSAAAAKLAKEQGNAHDEKMGEAEWLSSLADNFGISSSKSLGQEELLADTPHALMLAAVTYSGPSYSHIIKNSDGKWISIAYLPSGKHAEDAATSAKPQLVHEGGPKPAGWPDEIPPPGTVIKKSIGPTTFLLTICEGADGKPNFAVTAPAGVPLYSFLSTSAGGKLAGKVVDPHKAHTVVFTKSTQAIVAMLGPKPDGTVQVKSGPAELGWWAPAGKTAPVSTAAGTKAPPPWLAIAPGAAPAGNETSAASEPTPPPPEPPAATAEPEKPKTSGWDAWKLKHPDLASVPVGTVVHIASQDGSTSDYTKHTDKLWKYSAKGNDFSVANVFVTNAQMLSEIAAAASTGGHSVDVDETGPAPGDDHPAVAPPEPEKPKAPGWEAWKLKHPDLKSAMAAASVGTKITAKDADGDVFEYVKTPAGWNLAEDVGSGATPLSDGWIATQFAYEDKVGNEVHVEEPGDAQQPASAPAPAASKKPSGWPDWMPPPGASHVLDLHGAQIHVETVDHGGKPGFVVVNLSDPLDVGHLYPSVGELKHHLDALAGGDVDGDGMHETFLTPGQIVEALGGDLNMGLPPLPPDEPEEAAPSPAPEKPQHPKWAELPAGVVPGWTSEKTIKAGKAPENNGKSATLTVTSGPDGAPVYTVTLPQGGAFYSKGQPVEAIPGGSMSFASPTGAAKALMNAGATGYEFWNMVGGKGKTSVKPAAAAPAPAPATPNASGWAAWKLKHAGNPGEDAIKGWLLSAPPGAHVPAYGGIYIKHPDGYWQNAADLADVPTVTQMAVQLKAHGGPWGTPAAAPPAWSPQQPAGGQDEIEAWLNAAPVGSVVKDPYGDIKKTPVGSWEVMGGLGTGVVLPASSAANMLSKPVQAAGAEDDAAADEPDAGEPEPAAPAPGGQVTPDDLSPPAAAKPLVPFAVVELATKSAAPKDKIGAKWAKSPPSGSVFHVKGAAGDFHFVKVKGDGYVAFKDGVQVGTGTQYKDLALSVGLTDAEYKKFYQAIKDGGPYGTVGHQPVFMEAGATKPKELSEMGAPAAAPPPPVPAPAPPPASGWDVWKEKHPGIAAIEAAGKLTATGDADPTGGKPVSVTFKKTDGAEQQSNAVLYGQWLAHPNLAGDGTWTITHGPTLMGINKFLGDLTEDQAKAVAQALDADPVGSTIVGDKNGTDNKPGANDTQSLLALLNSFKDKLKYGEMHAPTVAGASPAPPVAASASPPPTPSAPHASGWAAWNAAHPGANATPNQNESWLNAAPDGAKVKDKDGDIWTKNSTGKWNLPPNLGGGGSGDPASHIAAAYGPFIVAAEQSVAAAPPPVSASGLAAWKAAHPGAMAAPSQTVAWLDAAPTGAKVKDKDGDTFVKQPGGIWHFEHTGTVATTPTLAVWKPMPYGDDPAAPAAASEEWWASKPTYATDASAWSHAMAASVWMGKAPAGTQIQVGKAVWTKPAVNLAWKSATGTNKKSPALAKLVLKAGDNVSLVVPDSPEVTTWASKAWEAQQDAATKAAWIFDAPEGVKVSTEAGAIYEKVSSYQWTKVKGAKGAKNLSNKSIAATGTLQPLTGGTATVAAMKPALKVAAPSSSTAPTSAPAPSFTAPPPPKKESPFDAWSKGLPDADTTPEQTTVWVEAAPPGAALPAAGGGHVWKSMDGAGWVDQHGNPAPAPTVAGLTQAAFDAAAGLGPDGHKYPPGTKFGWAVTQKTAGSELHNDVLTAFPGATLAPNAGSANNPLPPGHYSITVPLTLLPAGLNAPKTPEEKLAVAAHVEGIFAPILAKYGYTASGQKLVNHVGGVNAFVNAKGDAELVIATEKTMQVFAPPAEGSNHHLISDEGLFTGGTPWHGHGIDYDSDAVRDQHVSVTKKKGGAREIRFKLTNWAGNTVAGEATAWAAGKWNIGGGAYDPQTGEASPIGTVYKELSTRIVSGPGWKAHYCPPPPPPSTKSDWTTQNQVKIDVEPGTTVEQALQQFAAAAGIPEMAGPPSEAAMEHYRLRKLIWNAAPAQHNAFFGQDGGKKSPPPTNAELRAAIKKAGLTDAQIDSAKVVSIGPGHRAVKVEDGQAFVDKGIHGLYHNWFSSDAKDMARKLAAGGNVATAQRWKTGMGGKGQSSPDDMHSGGGDYVFHYVFRPQDNYFGGLSSGHGIHIVTGPETLERTDWHAATGDNFGNCGGAGVGHSDKFYNRKNRRSTLSAHSAGSGEVMVQNAVGLEEIRAIVCDSAKKRADAISEFKALGVHTIGGRPVEDVVVTSHTQAAKNVSESWAATQAARSAS